MKLKRVNTYIGFQDTYIRPHQWKLSSRPFESAEHMSTLKTQPKCILPPLFFTSKQVRNILKQVLRFYCFATIFFIHYCKLWSSSFKLCMRHSLHAGRHEQQEWLPRLASRRTMVNNPQQTLLTDQQQRWPLRTSAPLWTTQQITKQRALYQSRIGHSHSGRCWDSDRYFCHLSTAVE